MSNIPDQLLNDFKTGDWLQEVASRKDCFALEGALFKHSSADKVYFACAHIPGVRFEFAQSDIVELKELQSAVSILGHSFKGVKILLKADAPVTRISVHLASELVDVGVAPATELDDKIVFKSTLLASVQLR